MNHRNLIRARQNQSRGFSTLELLLVMVVSLVIAALAIPKFDQVRRSLRIQGDARDLNGAINEAKLQAAAEFTRARVYADLGANTFHIDVWNKAAACWKTVGDLANACVVDGVSPVQNLAPGVTFGFSGVANAPPNTQTTFGQAPRCGGPNGLALGFKSNTACIVFNSRGTPVDGLAFAPIGGNDAFYITDGSQVYGVTLSSTGLSQVWATSASGPGAGTWYHK